MKALFFLLVVPALWCQAQSTKATAEAADTSGFAARLEALRQHYQIPSLSIGIVQGKKLIWYRGLGYADIEQKIVPTEHTIYHLASVTKTFGSIILMQLVEAGKINLDDPVTKYGINLGARWGDDDRIKLKHLLTHTAQGNSFNGFKPGYSFGYNGDYYGRLIKPIEQEAGRSFGQLMVEQIIRPLGLTHTAPNPADMVNFSLTGYDRTAYDQLIAKPYDLVKGRVVPATYPSYFGPSAGLLSCVSDLAIYSIAIDEGRLLSAATWEQIFTSFRSPKGKPMPYGLGWFVQSYKGIKLLWHTGWWTGNSSLLIKIPEKDLTFIILANSQDLSRPFYAKYDIFRTNPRLQKDLRASAFARAFLDQFVFHSIPLSY
ncbi:beta-lactamase family protein [Spirosoma sp. BT702]|uniref:Beta-lactamase family protein n=1 Tax=Spirosoma profusum TaxID=2771354 RepID=A0A927AV86_9BACT|nr:serine hydrolase domain-containing protein [Spirosoma profusum]MBD2705048.1 beta-lactamase family protein [Spirosoma profusum]